MSGRAEERGARRRPDRRVVEIARSLDGLAEGGPSAVTAALPAVRDLVGADRLVHLEIVMDGGSLRAGRLDALGMPGETFRRGYDDLVRGRAPVGWSLYNPIRPEPAQRNAVFGYPEMVRVLGTDRSPARDELYPKIGLYTLDHLRVLLCDGPALLGWLGVFRAERFGTRERRALRALVPALARRLRLERQLGDAPLTVAALAAVLEAMALPAAIVRGPARIVHANSFARAWMERDLGGFFEALGGGGGADVSCERTAIQAPGFPPHDLCVVRRRRDAARRIDRAAARWRLTPYLASRLLVPPQLRSSREPPSASDRRARAGVPVRLVSTARMARLDVASNPFLQLRQALPRGAGRQAEALAHGRGHRHLSPPGQPRLRELHAR